MTYALRDLSDILSNNTRLKFVREATRMHFNCSACFFGPEMLNVMVSNTNNYALRNYKNQMHSCKLFSLPELYVWLGCVVYMGVHPEVHMDYYWRSVPSVGGPQHILGKYIGSTRFHQSGAASRLLTVGRALTSRISGMRLSNHLYISSGRPSEYISYQEPTSLSTRLWRRLRGAPMT
jgi:hypothetical protein